MELPDVGERCSNSACKQLDFLPFKCECGRCFCSDHFHVHVEQCSVRINACEKKPQKIEHVYRCTFPKCTASSLIPLICERCEQHFCVPHRHFGNCASSSSATAKEKTASPAQLFTEAKLIVDKQLDENISQAKRRGKSELADKIQLMRLKNKASGSKSIPPEERVFFRVLFSSENSTESLPLFVSRTWTVGKIMDVFAQQFKILNNNRNGAGLKLRLFRETDGRIVSKNASEKLDILLKNDAVSNGETLRFTFASDDCTVLEMNK